MAKPVARNITISINGKEVENSLSGVGKEIGKLKGQLRKETFGSENFNKLNTQLKATQKEYARMSDEVRGGSKAFKDSNKSVLGSLGGLTKFASVFTLVSGALQTGIGFAKEFISDAIELSREAGGVQFAFEDLGVKGAQAFTNIKESTRGLLSSLDIKKALVEFSTFKIDLEETDTLMEFLAVRATQTGKSVDSLKDSLVEGLSKESKLRIDNLGISASELNDELEKTPDFVQAVANIAKREITAAGNILDEAADSSQRFNATLENAKVRIGSLIQTSGVGSFFRDIGSSMLEAITPAEDLNTQFKEQGRALIELQSELPPLIDEYENLTSKSDLSNVEQERLKQVVQDIARITPSAVTAFDEYGNALDISADKARDFIGTQQALLKFRNKEALEEQNEELAKYETEITNATLALSKFNEQGKLFRTVTTSAGIGGVSISDQVLSDKQINELQVRLARAQELAAGARASIEELSGDALGKLAERDKQASKQALEQARERARILQIPYSDEATASQIEGLIKQQEALNEQKTADREKQAERDAQRAEQEAQKKKDDLFRNEQSLTEFIKAEREARNLNALEGLAKEEERIRQKYATEIELAQNNAALLKQIEQLRDEELEEARATAKQAYLDRLNAIDEANEDLKDEAAFEREIAAAETQLEKDELRLERARELALEELKILEEAELAKVNAVDGAEELKAKIRENFALQGEKLNREFDKQERDLKQDQVKWTELTEQQKLGAITGALATAAEAFNEGSAAWKATKIAETLISTYQGAQNAFNALAPIPIVGPALGTAAAGLAVVAGLKKVQTISNTKLEKIKKPKGYYDGGYTGSRSYGRDHQGDVAGVVHTNEWVAPAVMTSDPKYANIIGWLERERTGRTKGYFNGGPVTAPSSEASTSIPTAVPSGDDLSRAILTLNSLLASGITANVNIGYPEAESIAGLQNEINQREASSNLT